MENKKWALWLGILIPIFMLFAVIGSLWLPRLAAQPTFNFVYKLEWANYGSREKPMPSSSRYFVYDVKKHLSTEISLNNFQTIILDKNSRAPDGYQVVPNYNDAGFFGFIFGPGSDRNTYLLKNQSIAIKLNIPRTYNNRYYADFTFLGWLKPQGA